MASNPFHDLRALRVFLAVSETGTMSAGARRVGLTQSAVSHSIRQLETNLGVALVDRDRRPLRLTAAGAMLRQRATGLLDEAEHLPNALRGAAGAAAPEIRLGLVDSFAATVGPSLIKAFMHSAAQLSVWCGLSPAHGDALLAGHVDAIVTSDPLDEVDDLERHRLLREPFLLLTPRDGPRVTEGASAAVLEALAAELPIIRYSARSHIGSRIDLHLRRVGARVPRRLEFDTSDTLVAMVASGVGWAISTPLCLLQGRAHLARVRVSALPAPTFSRQITLVAKAGVLGDLPARLAERARLILSTEIQAEIAGFAPELGLDMTVGEPDGTSDASRTKSLGK